jgi:hypothetical protein
MPSVFYVHRGDFVFLEIYTEVDVASSTRLLEVVPAQSKRGVPC